MAVGVANPNAQGQEITRTEIAIVNAKWKLSPSIIQVMHVTIAIAITTGTKYPEITSAILAIGALEFPASSTKAIICDKVD